MRRALVPALSTLAVSLAACTAPSGGSEPVASNTTPAGPLYVRHAMQAEVNPAIVGIWDVTNNIFTDAGEQDASLITDEQWVSLAENAAKLAATGERMAAAGDIRAAAPGNMATGEYEVAMADVQGFISADPQGFRNMSASFAALSRNLETTAIAKDGATMLDLVAQMDTECAACHAQYWYAGSQ